MANDFQFCRICGVGWLPGKLSNRGLCPLCSKRLSGAAISQMKAHHGPIYDKWRHHYISAMDGVLQKLRKEQQDHD